MVAPHDVVVVGAPRSVNGRTVRAIRGSLLDNLDLRFTRIAGLSLALHLAFVLGLNSIRLQSSPVPAFEKVPERFLCLILQRPAAVDAPRARAPRSAADTPVPAAHNRSVPGAAPGANRKSVSRRDDIARKKAENSLLINLLKGSRGGEADRRSPWQLLPPNRDNTEHVSDIEKMLARSDGIRTFPVSRHNSAGPIIVTKDIHMGREAAVDDGFEVTRHEIRKAGDVVIQPPKVVENSATAIFLRNDKALRAAVQARSREILMLYQRHLKRNPGLAGKVSISITIAASGAVLHAQVEENTTGDIDFETDLVASAMTWRFDSVSSGQVTAKFPFLFKPPSGSPRSEGLSLAKLVAGLRA